MCKLPRINRTEFRKQKNLLLYIFVNLSFGGILNEKTNEQKKCFKAIKSPKGNTATQKYQLHLIYSIEDHMFYLS